MTSWRPDPQQDPSLPELSMAREVKRVRAILRDLHWVGVLPPGRARRLVRFLRATGRVKGMSTAQILNMGVDRVRALLVAHEAKLAAPPAERAAEPLQVEVTGVLEP